jgi:hypothetical protein
MLRLIDSIYFSPSPISTISEALSSLQQTTCKIFEQMKSSIALSITKFQQSIDFHPLLKPENIVEGGLWAGFWGLCVIFSSKSLHQLYSELTIEHPAAEKFAKIGKAVKTAFIDLISLGGATAYNAHWAHEAKILSLGQYAPLVKGLGYGASLVINTIEGGWAIYNIHTEKEAILKETSPILKEKHKQQLFFSLMKLVGNVSMVAWTALSIIPIAWGFAVSSLLTSTFLFFGCTCSFAAFFYQRHIEKTPAETVSSMIY